MAWINWESEKERRAWSFLIGTVFAVLVMLAASLGDAPEWTVEPLTAAEPKCPADYPVLHSVDAERGVYVCFTEVPR